MIAAFCLEDIAIQEIYVNSNLIMSNLNTREAEGGREGEGYGNSSHASTDKDLSPPSALGIPGRRPRFDGLACCGVGRGRAVERELGPFSFFHGLRCGLNRSCCLSGSFSHFM